MTSAPRVGVGIGFTSACIHVEGVRVAKSPTIPHRYHPECYFRMDANSIANNNNILSRKLRVCVWGFSAVQLRAYVPCFGFLVGEGGLTCRFGG